MNIFMRKAFVIFVLWLLVPSISLGANVFFDTNNKEFTIGGDTLVQVFVDTEKASINAMEGKLIYPTDLLELVDIQDGNSAINFWIEKPSSTESGMISFSGITAGGVTKPKALLFGAVFHSKKSGQGQVLAQVFRLLQNDGKGTEVKVKTAPLSFSVSTESGSVAKELLKIEDTTPPETFKPIIGSDPNMFDGKYFVAFATQDKGSGMDHFEIRERMFGKYFVATSPYILENQSLNRSIYIKAVDKAKNELVVKLAAEKSIPLYQELGFLGIILLIAILLLRKKSWRKSKK